MAEASRPSKHLILDSDALLDLSIALGPALGLVLKKLRDEFDVVCVLLEEIRNEVEDNAAVDSATWSTLVGIVDRLAVEGVLVDPGSFDDVTAPTVSNYRNLGKRLNEHVGREAYAHAYGCLVHGTVLSRDAAAERTLRSENLPHSPRVEPIDVFSVVLLERWGIPRQLIGGLRRLKRLGRLQRGSGIVDMREPEQGLANFDSRIKVSDRCGATENPVLMLVRSAQRRLNC